MVYGDVTLNNASNSLELTELLNESSDLRDTLHEAELDLQRLRTENEKTWECTDLLSQLSESRVEVERMRSGIDEVRKRVEVTVAKEKEIRVLKAELEKVRKQRDRLVFKNRSLELSNDAVKTSAVSNLRRFLRRVKTLEDNVASLMDNSNSSGSLVDHFG